MPLSVMPTVGSISLILGRTSRWIRPLPSTIGTKSTCVPNLRNWIEIVPKLCGTGIGISPPDRK